MKNSITCNKVYTAGEVFYNKEIFFENGLITEIKDFSREAEFANIAPAFFDTHINGGEELYFTEHPNIEALEDMISASQKTGTGFILACLITSDTANILNGISAVKQFMVENPNGGILGMHLEGPFLNIKKRGAHLAKYVRKPTNEEIGEILEAGKEVIKIWTIAPENFSEKQIQLILDAGVTISAGHSNATAEEAAKAFKSGITLVTHLYNAMSAFGHREPGLIGATLANKNVWAPIILDGHHCHFDAAKVAYNSKKEKLFIISDALFLGGKKSHFQWQEFDAFLEIDTYRNSEGNLAGGAISVGQCIYNAVNKVGIPLTEAIDMATRRPFEAINLQANLGKIDVGYQARFTSFDDSLRHFSLI